MFPKFFQVLSDLLLILFQVINPVNDIKSPEKKFEEKAEPQFEVGTKNYRDTFYTDSYFHGLYYQSQIVFRIMLSLGC